MLVVRIRNRCLYLVGIIWTNINLGGDAAAKEKEAEAPSAVAKLDKDSFKVNIDFLF